MPRRVYFVTHPDVVIDPALPVPRWPLSARGRERMHRLLDLRWVRQLAAVYSSTEQKAIDGAEILARAAGLRHVEVAELGENDRSSTGYLPKAEFEATADAFFARPEESVRGWEKAVEAQQRVRRAVDELVARTPAEGAIAIVSHGGVGTLLLCAVSCEPISRRREQPGGNGGNFFVFDTPPPRLVQAWTPIDDA